MEWKTLGEVCDYIRGITYNKSAETTEVDGWKVLRANNITLETRKLNFNEVKHVKKTIRVRENQMLRKGDILICAGSGSKEHIGKTAYIESDIDYTFGGFMGVLRLKEEKTISSRYLFHYIGSGAFTTYLGATLKSSTINNLNNGIISPFTIPVPPLRVQARIVEILDKFTQLEAELEKELEAELEARKKQYAYYRDQLLNFSQCPPLNVNIEWKTLGEVCENLDSQRRPITSSKRKKGIYPYYGASGIVDFVESYIYEGDYLLVSEDGANLLARNTPIAFSISGKNWVNNHAHVLKFDTYEGRKFVEYYLNHIDLEPYISGAAQPKLNQNNLNSIPIPIPPLSEQRRIVDILDRFDTLTNSISEGLPKEIALRRKQYEYYRDALLNFPRAEVTA